MNLKWFQSLVMGFVSGLAGLLPISAEAHRGILSTIFGIETEDPVFRLLCRLACLLVLAWSLREEIYQLRRTNRRMKRARRRQVPPDLSSVCTIRVLRSAAGPMVVGKLFTMQLSFISGRMELLALVLIVNGVLLYVPRLLPAGNKDPRNMARLDGMLMGLGAGLSVVPGISMIGASVSLGLARGVDRRQALRLSMLLMMAGLAVEAVFDVIALTGSAVTFSGMGLVIALLGAVLAGFGARIGIRSMEFLAFKAGFSGFAYYCWGMALICVFLYLIA